MKKIYFIVAIGLLILLFMCSLANAVVIRDIRIGKAWARILDNGQFAETAALTQEFNWYYTYSGHSRATVRCAGTRLGCANWTDENGTLHTVKLAGAPYGEANNDANWFELPYPGEENLTLKRYYRYQPPIIEVDGFFYQDRFPLDGDEVDASKIPGTADVMTESYIRNWMGVEIHARTLAWSQKHHDDYIIYDWVFTNTGNIDRDNDVELNNTLTDLYIMRQQEMIPNATSEWSEYYGENMSDTSRIMFSTPTRRKRDSQDMYGIQRREAVVGEDRVYHLGQTFVGEGALFIQKAWNDQTDWPSQPRMHCVAGPDDLAFKQESGGRSLTDHLLVYQVMQEGYRSINPCLYMHEAFPEADVYPNTAHDVEFPKRGKPYLDDFAPWWFWHQVASNASGPWDLPIGESLRYVWAIVHGALGPELAWAVYQDWDAGVCTWPELGMTTGGDPEDLGELYPTFKDFPDVAPTVNDRAKDRWVVTGRDSMLMNNYAALWNMQNNYEVPIPPPPPSIKVTSLPNAINISWGSESESASDFAGYRVYRAEGSNYYHWYQGVELGKWEKIYEVIGSGTHSYGDATAERGKAYYYYVTAFDNGTANGPDVYTPAGGEVLESGQYANMTTSPAYLTREPGETLEEIRVVPNPFNIHAVEMNYPGEPNKIMFLDLPLECTIYIYNETLDLIKTIEHYGSGDESWGLTIEEHMTTETGQLVVSGLYIAVIETPEGESAIRKIVIIR